ncbi:Ribosome biogenesis protein erb1 [Erysiphe neolycopersici]|uniref:Ribosome biogenesis protein ERB1 n=1 Tax=Erysiphe neolycopersici TaxID=212602 RepID=A0A420HYJ3_9PEZI|nr:Ribosome biogenesis protein erb1 [Erysiphe neolycopersici]
MASTNGQIKRKAEAEDLGENIDNGSETGFGEGLLDGIFSESEDESSENLENSDNEGTSDSEISEGSRDVETRLLNGKIKGKRDGDKANGTTSFAKQIAGDINTLEDDEDKPNYVVTKDANGRERYVYNEIEPGYDSDDSDAPVTTNTIGNIPLSFYDTYPHIGYDINGKKVMRPAKGEALDALLDSIEVPKGWTGLTDPATGKPLQLSQDELEILRKIQINEVPGDGYDPYPDTIEYFTSIKEIMPLSAAPEPKQRFIPSKNEAKKVMKIVRAIREGRILPYRPPEELDKDEESFYYDIWKDEKPHSDNVMNIPAPKIAPPGYELSYNPPPEYLPSKKEKEEWESIDPDDREKEYLPTRYDSLRKVPAYNNFLKERFERCLDLYLAPRVRKNRLNIDPSSLLPKLPRPEELRPFPSTCSTLFCGHEGRVRSLEIDPSGIWLASGGDDGTIRIWELLTGRQIWSVKIEDDVPVNVVRWRPGSGAVILLAAVGESMFFIVPPITDPETEVLSRDLIDSGFGYAKNLSSTTTANEIRKVSAAKWARPGMHLENEGVILKITTRNIIKVISWHRKGDFFSTVSPTAQKSAVAIHTMSKHLTQIPFRRLPGIPQTAQFHPNRPIFFVATQQAIRSYDLQKQELLKILQPGARWISSIDIHPGGDNLIVGSYDRRLLWHDLDLSTRPYKTLRFHSKAIRTVKFHKGGFPLFADASDDGSLQIFHGKVVNDMMENATIVPLKVLKGHKVKNALGVMDIDWHPREPWCVSAGADGTCRLWM